MILHAGPMVRLVLLLLLFFSITSWAIIFTKYRFIRKARKESAYFLELFWNSPGLSEAYSASKHLGYSPVARVFRVAYVEHRKVNKSQSSSGGSDRTDEPSLSQKMVAVDNIKRALRRAVNVELTGLGKALPFLAVVAPGISEALIATAAGLAAAIPAVVAYNYFTSKVRILESEMHNFSADFLNLIERDLMRRKGK
ncbi:MAG: MotA/TolQ/ExbB proton channel family protein [Deltaproteobacteria bacterium]|nr:MotA/TolQ/ExbB proton channel family protein [Deltaproteobacteria bacterium]